MAVKKYKNTFYLVKSLFQSFNLWIHLAEARTAPCTLTSWCYQLITNSLPSILWHKQTALQINRKRKLYSGDLLCFGPVSCCQWYHNQIMKMSLPQVILWTEVEILDCYNHSLMLLFQMSHYKCSQNQFSIPLPQSALSGKCFNRNFLYLVYFLDLGANAKQKMWNTVRKEQQPSLTRLFNGTQLVLLLLFPAVPMFWNFEKGPLLLHVCF